MAATMTGAPVATIVMQMTNLSSDVLEEACDTPSTPKQKVAQL